MKLHEVRTKYHFNQRTFYKWMSDMDIIYKDTTGYVVGEDALAGMKTLTTEKLNVETGAVELRTQVMIDDEQVELLVALYLDSGYPRLYSSTKQESAQDDVETLKSEINALTDRVMILENQLKIMNIKLKQVLNA
ncbi:hypothetical protein B9T11_05385 [Wohlfahrtiimonas chitiniclastica]|uniref:hypothetical protein n=2 Tax=Wohlfahrtiimonas chitiniclastica TaxID=400946 RepID=UPI000B984BCC|nr:hypothetical protein [Wohlfahrtiimonas chitiniclastica]MBS7815785.1 hypothetical protein [Wohlfahrtiimonas chitiniclastica]MBS7823301.1 hypothetical protein [Wohlfahrtiimonas chitiniclastica]MBS7831137.1 hypothetical protein [Wohlfahrtiimonas chitiniclastica]MBS7833104.1 hypothetical protein [Wohlfahrtiimonas chitiniclastica]OYQ69505.1 hypothetical protein B9T13_08060 [Wohlfahrtiimonas chitiniclastica]